MTDEKCSATGGREECAQARRAAGAVPEATRRPPRKKAAPAGHRRKLNPFAEPLTDMKLDLIIAVCQPAPLRDERIKTSL